MAKAPNYKAATPEKEFILRGHDTTTRKDKIICVVRAPNLTAAVRKLGGTKATGSTFQNFVLGDRGRDFVPGPQTETLIVRQAEAAGFGQSDLEVRQRLAKPLAAFSCFNLVEILAIK